jgi:hypothetical protein
MNLNSTFNEKILRGKPEGKRLLRRHRFRWEYNIKTNLRNIRWEVENGIHLTLDRKKWRAFVNMVMSHPVP